MADQPKVEVQDLTYRYGEKTALDNVSLNVPPRAVTALFGPAGGGKTTLLRLINRLNDTVEDTHRRGRILIDGQDIYAPGTDVPSLRRRVGMVFASPLPLPMTIFENVTYGPRLRGVRGKRLEELAERSLKQAAIWDEVAERLHTPAMALSGGQQQRVCLARVLALEPEVILLDEPTSGLDPISTAKVEESLLVLKQEYAIVMVPHSVQQAARVADYAAFLLMGEMVEAAPGVRLFTHPHDKRTEDYVTGRFG